MNLDGTWHLSCASKSIHSVPITIPGDIHTALIDAGKIPDPYWGTNEADVQWVHTVDWTISKTFQMTHISMFQAFVMVLEMVDTFATVKVNGHFVVNTTNYFRFWRNDIKPYLHEGTNNVEIVFHPATEVANATYDRLLPSVYPWSYGNNQEPNMNLIRKPQFQSGWDWGLCLIPAGIYKSIEIVPVKSFDLEEVAVTQLWTGSDCTLQVDVEMFCYQETTEPTTLTVSFADANVVVSIPPMKPGKVSKRVEIPVQNVDLWTTHEFGAQPLYNLTASIDGQVITKRIGIRKIEVVREADSYGTSFLFKINGNIVNVKGANMIPVDSIPSRMTYERTRGILMDMKESNMNMVRIWGGGFYNEDVFKICDELGILVWQDLMFACAQYPTDSAFLQEISDEFECQIKRNKHHASIAMWCGDNEDFQAINWFSEFTQEYKEWLRGEYKKLNQFCKECIEALDPSRVFWPASPCDGTFDYKQPWSYQTAGDIHYWEVWQSSKPFETFYEIKPRFCSEFGYQSWPSLPTVRTFCPDDQFDITSKVFSAHQKNGAGNTYIQNMFHNYFRMPVDFYEQLYLSQVQQAFAIRMGCEYWRTCKPETRGILYWQINDVWPVSSWSSIEYSGRWKQLQYHARRFFAPLLVTFFDDKDVLKVIIVNDKLCNASITGTIKLVDYIGDEVIGWTIDQSIGSDCAETVVTIEHSQYEQYLKDAFFYAELKDLESGTEFANFWVPIPFKDTHLQDARIDVKVEQNPLGGTIITLIADKPTLFVHLESDKVKKFSDSSFVMMKNVEKVITCPETIDESDLTIYQLGKQN